jgi:hypothetical protein
VGPGLVYFCLGFGGPERHASEADWKQGALVSPVLVLGRALDGDVDLFFQGF